MLIAGTARSGTTWLADIIASQMPCRVMFEPFHSGKVKGFSQFNYFQYMHPEEENNDLYTYCYKLFTGDIRDSWIDRKIDNLNPQSRLVKDIRANLFLKWISQNFPQVPILFIIRHPCAVVLSRMKLDWATDTDIYPFLAQREVIGDFLSDKMDIIKKAKTDVEKHAIVWCVSNLVPLKQFNSGGLSIIFYENLCIQPHIEIPKIFKTLQHEYKNSVFDHINKPSTTSMRTSAVLTGENKVTRWKRELSPEQISNIMSVVETFKLDHIYGESVMPLISTQ
jgi:hypothetical protein